MIINAQYLVQLLPTTKNTKEHGVTNEDAVLASAVFGDINNKDGVAQGGSQKSKNP
jgi:hypothetical protein